VFDIRTIAVALRTLKPTKNSGGVLLQIYDPLGFLSPSNHHIESLLSGAMQSQDGLLSSELLCNWNCVVSNFQGVVISVPRCQVQWKSVFCMAFVMLLSFTYVICSLKNKGSSICPGDHIPIRTAIMPFTGKAYGICQDVIQASS